MRDCRLQKNCRFRTVRSVFRVTRSTRVELRDPEVEGTVILQYRQRRYLPNEQAYHSRRLQT